MGLSKLLWEIVDRLPTFFADQAVPEQRATLADARAAINRRCLFNCLGGEKVQISDGSLVCHCEHADVWADGTSCRKSGDAESCGKDQQQCSIQGTQVEYKGRMIKVAVIDDGRAEIDPTLE